MFNSKLLASILLVLAVMFAQVGNVAAAPQTQDGTTTTIDGTIQSITVDPNTGNVVVTVLLEDQVTTQTVSLNPLDPAYGELFNPDTHELLAQVGETVAWDVNAEDVVPAEEPVAPDVHPISMLLAKFFFGGEDDLGLTYEMASLIDSFHTGENEADQVFGFGVIAQALWMSRNINDGTADANLAEEILQAKKSGDYSQIELPEGFTWPNDTAPTNWGQFKKAIKGLNENKEKQNLGVIVSGQEQNGTQDPTLQQDNKENGKNNKDKHNNGKSKKHNNGKP